jgi:2-oxoisovalerate dehydrogenase E1 component
MESWFYPQAEWILDAVHERLMPLPGHRVTTDRTLRELVRRARLGI